MDVNNNNNVMALLNGCLTTFIEGFSSSLIESMKYTRHPTPEDALSELGRAELLFIMLVNALSKLDIQMSYILFKKVEDWQLFPRVTTYLARKLQSEWAIPKETLEIATKFASFLKECNLMEVPTEFLEYLNLLIAGGEENDLVNGHVVADRDVPVLQEEKNSRVFKNVQNNIPEGATVFKKFHTKYAAQWKTKSNPASEPLRPHPSLSVPPISQRNEIDIFDAVENNRYNDIKEAVRLGANINESKKNGEGPLHIAIKYAFQDSVKVLIDLGADVNMTDKFLMTPLHHAAKEGNVLCSKLLIDAGAIVDAKDHYWRTPLHYASGEGFESCTALLLEAGADPKALSMQRNAPLHGAAVGKNVGCYKLLLKYGADDNVKNKLGRTPRGLLRKFTA